MRLDRLIGGVLILACAIGVGVAQPGRLPIQPRPPANVSSDPRGEQPPEFGLPPGEAAPTLTLDAEKVQAKAGEDYVDWSVKATGAEAAWAKGITGKGVKVGVGDTGIDPNHRDLKDALKGAKDFTNSSVGWKDTNSHGSHCAGSIAARKNGWGVQGVAYECDLYAAKVLGDSGSGSVVGIRDGILWLVNECDVDVVSLSLGGGGTESYIPTALKAAEEKGVIVLCAAGNDGNGRPVNYPAAYPFPIAVSAIDVGLRLADFSCTGSKVEVCGPGVNVRSTIPGDSRNPDGRFGDYNGTSMATPNEAGEAALWVQCDKAAGGERKTRPQRYRAWLAKSGNCRDLGAAGRDANFGHGLPDASKLELPKDQPPPVVPPPAPLPGKIVIDGSKLTDAAKEELRKGGFGDFRFEFTPIVPPKPAPADAPTISHEAFLERLKKGPVTVFVGVPADLAKHPDGVYLTKLPPGGLPPGVYTAEIEESINFYEAK